MIADLRQAAPGWVRAREATQLSARDVDCTHCGKTATQIRPETSTRASLSRKSFRRFEIHLKHWPANARRIGASPSQTIVKIKNTPSFVFSLPFRMRSRIFSRKAKWAPDTMRRWRRPVRRNECVIEGSTVALPQNNPPKTPLSCCRSTHASHH